MIQEAFGGQRQIAATLTAATSLLLTGLAAAVAFRAGIFRRWRRGLLLSRRHCCAVIGCAAPTWPSFVLILIALAAASLAARALAGGTRPLACSLGRGRSGYHAHAQFHRGRIDELARQRAVARARLRQLSNTLDRENAELPRLLPPTTLHLESSSASPSSCCTGSGAASR